MSMLMIVILRFGGLVKDFGTTAVALSAAVLGLLTYWRNARTRRAEFILQLHEAFFVDSTFTEVRKIIDIDNEDDENYRALLEGHDERLVDFLNYFELIAYLRAKCNISRDDVKALVGYYLRIIRKLPSLRGYVTQYSFEYLEKLLDDKKLFDRID